MPSLTPSRTDDFLTIPPLYLQPCPRFPRYVSNLETTAKIEIENETDTNTLDTPVVLT